MKILVPIKRVPDPYAKIKVNSSGDGIETVGLKYEINPFDEIAVEEAVRIAESAHSEIVVVSIGSVECEEQIRKALAMGANRAILVETSEECDSLGIAKILSKIADKEQPDIILMGKQAIDDDSNQSGQMLAAIRKWPQATCASKITLENGSVQVIRETDTGQETLKMPLPAVITADLRLNEPRYVALPGIIKARTKPIEKLTLSDMGIKAENRVKITTMRHPQGRAPGRKVANVDELVKALKEEAGVL
ncbi:MAG: electron transfer flavoprotein subunit beta/FixA family protein [Armatimonadetes bacterium]|nr:electron transfer flavoprotein subunit beta/FixA family protein [Armatimonadota bacterium]